MATYPIISPISPYNVAPQVIRFFVASNYIAILIGIINYDLRWILRRVLPFFGAAHMVCLLDLYRVGGLIGQSLVAACC